MKALAGWFIAVIAAYLVFFSLQEPDKDIADPYIVGLIGSTMFAGGLVMLLFTRTWSARGLGMMSVALGVSVLYLGSLLFYVAPETRRWFNPVTDAARAFLVVGGPLWAYGIIRYLQEAYWSRDDGDQPGGG